MATIKCCILGNNGVGKSAFVLQFVNNHFVDEYDPTIADTYRKQFQVDGEASLLDILDSAEGCADYLDEYLTTATVFIILYSITDRSSFDSVPKIKEEVLHHRGEAPTLLVLCGSKLDLDDCRKVSLGEAKQLSDAWGLESDHRRSLVFGVSAKAPKSIGAAFDQIVRTVRDFEFQQQQQQNAAAAATQKPSGKCATM